MAKITFVYPDYESLGVAYLMGVCRQNGHEVDFIYYCTEDAPGGRRLKHVPYEDIADEIRSSQPDIVAFSCVTDNYLDQLSVARAVKQKMPNAITLFGGVHPTSVPEKVLSRSEVDCVAIGEAEVSLSNFLRENTLESFKLPDKLIKGIVWKADDGGVIGKFEAGPLPDLNAVPFPDRDIFIPHLKDSWYWSVENYNIITSRGCPYKCAYCFNSYTHKLREGQTVRQRTVDNVIDELVWAKSHYRITSVSFVDDILTMNSKWLSEFCKRYKKEIGLPFICLSHPHYLSKEKIEELKSAGCISVHIGVQSISEEICKKILNRKTSNAKTAEALVNLRDAGIISRVDHMLGIPGDTLKVQEKSVLFYNKYRPDAIHVVWLTYYPKTSIVDIARRRGILTENDVKRIEEGKIVEELLPTTKTVAHAKPYNNPESYYCVYLLLHYLPILPRFLVSFLVYSRLYRIFRIKNDYLSATLPLTIIRRNVFKRLENRG